MKVIGLTGGIGAGKSTVSGILSDNYHLPIIDADLIARDVVLPGRPALSKIAHIFGSEMLTVDGEMDREKMGLLIQQNAKAKEQLEAITHQAIQETVQAKILKYHKAKFPFVIYDCPLLFEAHHDRLCDRTVLVTAYFDLRLSRLMARDQITRKMAEAKMAIQMAEAEKAALADDIINNSGDLIFLRSEIERVYRRWMR